MGKEVKIGVGVILILLITFGVVLARRLGGADDSAATAASNGENRETPQPDDSPAAGDTTPTIAAGGKPTVLEPKTDSSRTPAPTSNATGGWGAVPTTDQMQQVATADSTTAPPAWEMPNPPTPIQNDPYQNYSLPPQPASSLAGQQAPGAAAASSTGGPNDAFQHRTQQLAGSSVPQAQGTSALRVLATPGPSSLEPDAREYGPPSPGSYAENNLSQPSSTYRQTSRYQYSTAPQTPLSQNTTVPDTQTLSDSAYGADTAVTMQQARTENGEYEVQPNDNYWVISKKLYGSEAYFKALAEHNRAHVPKEDRLQVGDVISAPDLVELEASYPLLCPKPDRREVLRNRAMSASTRAPYAGGRIYVVEEGDTLFDIARYELGKASRWAEVHALNRDVLGNDYDYLVPGTELVLPDSGRSPDPVTSHPTNRFYQR
ncbi:MAG: LysM peptidoglycan-binding domain-containing protein [Pirellulales bacterium]|nr:LysM peptidoglycan-binding domain-containing protein [Pirellulales bacterium]